MQSLEAACEEGDVSLGLCIQCNQKSNNSYKTNMVCTHTRTFKKPKQSRTPLPLQPIQEPVPIEIQPQKAPFCIYTRLKELHFEETGQFPNQNSNTGLKCNSHLLEKLVAQERLNTLILNLYPGNKGYSLSFPTTPNGETCTTDETTGDAIETKQWPYEEKKLLEYLDNEEVPAFFVDLLEPQYGFLFYSGCIVAEIRDYRQAFPDFKCDIRYVLLKPSLESTLADINIMLDERGDWGSEEKVQLESQLILANNPKLCLEPSPKVSEIASNTNHSKLLFNTHKLRRTAHRYSQVSVNRKRLLDKFTNHPGLQILDYVSKLRARSKTGLLPSKLPKRSTDEIRPIPVPNLDPPTINAPAGGINIKEFKAYQKPRETSDCLPQMIEEYVLETDMPSKEKGKTRVYHIKLTILQCPSNSEYLGELYLDRDHKKGEQNGVACRFPLGSSAHANRYIQQFTDIFTEGGRKSVRINYGSGMKEQVAQVHAAQLQALQAAAQQRTLVQQQTTQTNNLNQPSTSPLVNGSSTTTGIVQQTLPTQNTTTVPVLQNQLQSTTQKTQAQVNQEIEINALATKLMNSAQQFQAAANAKQQQQQQKMVSTGNSAAIINLLNSSPASNLNSDASAAVVNAINNSTLLPQQVNQKLLGRKITLSNVPNARVLNHSNLIAVNNNRMNLQEIVTQSQHPQTITLTSVNSGNFIQGSYIKQRTANNENKSSLSALLVGTPAADRPDIISPNTNSLLLEKLANASNSNNQGQSPTHFIQSPKNAFAVQSPKNNQVLSPMSSPPPQNSNTINVQSLNFTPLPNLSGLQNVQVQLPGFSQPISLSLNVSSTGAIQGHPTGLIVSLPVTSATTTTTTVTQQATTVVTAGNNIVGTPTVVLANTNSSNLAHLMSSGVKTLTQQNIRGTTPTGVTLTQGGQPFQLVTQLQRPRIQQGSVQQNVTARTIQRQPITIKMATAATNSSQFGDLKLNFDRK
ncbi:transcription factor SPT20 homolog isoform X2 [Onthophagus taurus]|uniref:transcription factor SPT20 homolog isoform X2 n=1 Tax=Onthophagus taurus TaxID=166361 RepID=UPI000C20363C|nr:transcription factor SPT20 homolog isoform X2 [Onthophagus taurus]